MTQSQRNGRSFLYICFTSVLLHPEYGIHHENSQCDHARNFQCLDQIKHTFGRRTVYDMGYNLVHPAARNGGKYTRDQKQGHRRFVNPGKNMG